MKYRVIVAIGEDAKSSGEKLEEHVNSLLKIGWELQGGVSLLEYPTGKIVMTQAIKTTNRKLF